VATAADCVTDCPEHSQDRANYQDDDAYRPDNGDFRDEANNEEKYAEDNHEELQTATLPGGLSDGPLPG
jgi:hypothetical protein